MNNYLHVTWLTPQTAERHERRVMNIPPDVGLGWTPYIIRVTHNGVLAYKAFTSLRNFKLWLSRKGYKVRLNPHRSRMSPEYVIRTGRIVDAEGTNV